MTEQQGQRIIELLQQVLKCGDKPRVIDTDVIALDAAREIEDIFASGHLGGRAQRLAKVQVAVSRAIEDAQKAR